MELPYIDENSQIATDLFGGISCQFYRMNDGLA
jgi:hypothetical protein